MSVTKESFDSNERVDRDFIKPSRQHTDHRGGQRNGDQSNRHVLADTSIDNEQSSKIHLPNSHRNKKRLVSQPDTSSGNTDSHEVQVLEKKGGLIVYLDASGKRQMLLQDAFQRRFGEGTDQASEIVARPSPSNKADSKLAKLETALEKEHAIQMKQLKAESEKAHALLRVLDKGPIGAGQDAHKYRLKAGRTKEDVDSTELQKRLINALQKAARLAADVNQPRIVKILREKVSDKDKVMDEELRQTLLSVLEETSPSDTETPAQQSDDSQKVKTPSGKKRRLNDEASPMADSLKASFPPVSGPEPDSKQDLKVDAMQKQKEQIEQLRVSFEDWLTRWGERLRNAGDPDMLETHRIGAEESLKKETLTLKERASEELQETVSNLFAEFQYKVGKVYKDAKQDLSRNELPQAKPNFSKQEIPAAIRRMYGERADQANERVAEIKEVIPHLDVLSTLDAYAAKVKALRIDTAELKQYPSLLADSTAWAKRNQPELLDLIATRRTEIENDINQAKERRFTSIYQTGIEEAKRQSHRLEREIGKVYFEDIGDLRKKIGDFQVDTEGIDPNNLTGRAFLEEARKFTLDEETRLSGLLHEREAVLQKWVKEATETAWKTFQEESIASAVEHVEDLRQRTEKASTQDLEDLTQEVNALHLDDPYNYAGTYPSIRTFIIDWSDKEKKKLRKLIENQREQLSATPAVESAVLGGSDEKGEANGEEFELAPKEREVLLDLAAETFAEYQTIQWGKYENKKVMIEESLKGLLGQTIEEFLEGKGREITPKLEEKIREIAQSLLEEFERGHKSA